jgi:hypothetical protein
MTTTEFAPGTTLEVFFKCVRFYFRSERYRRFNAPWPTFCCAFARSLVVLKHALFQIPGDSGVVPLFICAANEVLHVKEILHLPACQAVAFRAQTEKVKIQPAFTSLRRGQPCFLAAL